MTMPTHPTDGPIQDWFSLSYTNYQVMPRTLMQSMPITWQERMVTCLEEITAAFAHVPQAEVYEVKAATEYIVSEMTAEQLEQAGIEADWYGDPGDVATGAEFADWQAQNETAEATYHRDGQELDPHERVLIGAVDPVPHYNRGRTYIEPAMPAAAIRAAAGAAQPDRAVLRDRVAEVLASADGWAPGAGLGSASEQTLSHYQGLADAVMAVAGTEQQELRAEQPTTSAPLAEVWTVWREYEPVYAHYATEDAAKLGTIDCWREEGPSCPEYSWPGTGARLELVAGDEPTGIYASRHTVYGASQPADRAAATATSGEAAEAQQCGDTKPHPTHTFLRLEVLSQCPGVEEPTP